VRNLYLSRARLSGELTQKERKQKQADRRTLGSFQERTRMEVRLHAVRQESLSRARKAIFARVIRAYLAARCKEHRPESNPRTELHNPTIKWKCVEPEHRAIELSLPRCTSEWATVIWRPIQIPRLECVRLFWRREEAKSRWHRTSKIATLWNVAGWRAWRCSNSDGDANGWRATFATATHPLFQFRLQIRLTGCALKTWRAEECPSFKRIFGARCNAAAAP